MKAIAILGGGLIKKDSVWKTIDFGEGGDDFAASNDRWRLDAAAMLWKKQSNYSIVVLGGKGQLTPIPDAPSVAQAIKKELLELKIPVNVILTEEKSGNTLEQLLELKKIARRENFEEIIILSNEWHLPRAQAIFEYYPGLKENFPGEINFMSAEEILLGNDSQNWQEKIKTARRDPELQKRYELEKKGVEQIENGTYKFTKYMKDEE